VIAFYLETRKVFEARFFADHIQFFSPVFEPFHVGFEGLEVIIFSSIKNKVSKDPHAKFTAERMTYNAQVLFDTRIDAY
jgi:hypothetical protein